MNEKLRAKDLINAGLFTVLYFVLGCCVAIPIGFVPIFLPILGSLWTLITGIPFMLFAVRARKFGMVTLMAILSGLLMGFTGMGFWGVPLGVVFGLLGDRIMKSGQYQSWRKTLLGYGVFQLSGGEKQKIACAGAFLMEPPVFVLDEPSANLDADAVLELRGVLKTLKALGKTVILSEHRLYYLRGLADRYLYLWDGRVQGDYSAEEFDAIPAEERRAMGLRVGSLADLTLREEPDIRRGTAQLRDFRFAYKNAPETLRIDEAAIPYGGIVGILGHNGAGKSTFSRCFRGLEKRRGTVTVDGTALRPKDRLDRCYMVTRDVGHQLFTESVLDEVLLSMPEEDEAQAKAILDRLDLTPYLDRHPASLSGGQKQRLAVASALAAERNVVFLDEPTSGLDDRHMRETAQLLRELRRSGKTVYVITHDPELITECCTDILRLEAGEIADSYPLDEAGLAKVRAFFRVEETD